MLTLDYPVRISSDLLVALGEFTGQHWSDSLALEPFVSEAILNYVQGRRAAQAQPESASDSEAGYQWKQVFLPDGTRLRASFKGQAYFADVKGEVIVHGGHAMSPSRFANLRGSGNRNAWKAVWLRFPGGEEWLLADVCRSARKAAIARLMGDDSSARRAPQEANRSREPHQPAMMRVSPREAAQVALAGQAVASGDSKTVPSEAGRGARGKRRAKKHDRGKRR